MNHHAFINTLRAAADKKLFFDLRAGGVSVRVGAGYHVTEVRAANVRAVDCGGREDAWAETVVQLWVPEGGGEGFMSAGKFVSIVERVAANVVLSDTANVRVEYGDAGAPAVSYHVGGVHVGDAAVVRLEIPARFLQGARAHTRHLRNSSFTHARCRKHKLLRSVKREELLCLTPLLAMTPGPGGASN